MKKVIISIFAVLSLTALPALATTVDENELNEFRTAVQNAVAPAVAQAVQENYTEDENGVDPVITALEKAIEDNQGVMIEDDHECQGIEYTTEREKARYYEYLLSYYQEFLKRLEAPKYDQEKIGNAISDINSYINYFNNNLTETPEQIQQEKEYYAQLILNNTYYIASEDLYVNMAFLAKPYKKFLETKTQEEDPFYYLLNLQEPNSVKTKKEPLWKRIINAFAPTGNYHSAG